MKKTPKNKQSPIEALSTSMTTSKKHIKLLFRPHNYRRQTRVGIKTNSTIKNIITLFPNSLAAHSKLISIKDYLPNITIQYGKETLTAIYHQNIIGGYKETYLIEANTIEEFNKRVSHYKNIRKEKLDFALYKFSKQYRIHLPYEKIEWSRAENWIRGEEYLDNIPREVILHDTHFKKVYMSGFEFLGNKGDDPTGTLTTYIKNRCLEDVAPEIVNKLDQFEEQALTPLTEQIKLHLKVQRETLKTLKLIQEANKKPLSKEWGW